MLWVFPIVDEEGENDEQIANDTHRSTPEDERVHGLVLLVGVQGIFAFAAAAFDT